MKNSNRKRKAKGLPLLYKNFQPFNSAIPYAYWCVAIDDYVTVNGRKATQVGMQTFHQRWNSKKWQKRGVYAMIEDLTTLESRKVADFERVKDWRKAVLKGRKVREDCENGPKTSIT